MALRFHLLSHTLTHEYLAAYGLDSSGSPTTADRRCLTYAAGVQVHIR
jgi:hypothetical protein